MAGTPDLDPTTQTTRAGDPGLPPATQTTHGGDPGLAPHHANHAWGTPRLARALHAYNHAVNEAPGLWPLARAVARHDRMADLLPEIHLHALRISGGRASVLLR